MSFLEISSLANHTRLFGFYIVCDCNLSFCTPLYSNVSRYIPSFSKKQEKEEEEEEGK